MIVRAAIPQASISIETISRKLVQVRYRQGRWMKIMALLFAISVCNPAISGHSAQLIDFESVPDGSTPFDGMVVSNQWQSFGVTFSFENGSYPILATPNGTNFAFYYPNFTTRNRSAPGENIGRFFLTDTASGVPPGLIVQYSSPVLSASGMIIDIDGNDAWAIEPRDVNTNIITNAVVTLNTTSFNAGDGKATPWTVASTQNIHSIRIRYTTATGGNVGLAFDNFSPTNALPEPAAASLSLTVQPSTISLTITGTPSALYQIQRASALPATNWTTLTNIYMPSQTFNLIDQPATNALPRFYRAIGIR